MHIDSDEFFNPYGARDAENAERIRALTQEVLEYRAAADEDAAMRKKSPALQNLYEKYEATKRLLR